MKQYLSTSDVAKLLGISRIAVFQRIRRGQIKAEKVGHSYVINPEDVGVSVGSEVSQKQKLVMNQAVKKTVTEYGATLRLLGKE
jgi:excisionase family DNA binding protein